MSQVLTLVFRPVLFLLSVFNFGEMWTKLVLCSPADVIRTIRDPEKPNTLEELEVVTEKCVEVQELGEEEYLIIIRFSPTVPHCSLATLIGAAASPLFSIKSSSDLLKRSRVCAVVAMAAESDGVFACRSLPPGEAAAVFALQTQGERHNLRWCLQGPRPEPTSWSRSRICLQTAVCRFYRLFFLVSSAGNLHF